MFFIVCILYGAPARKSSIQIDGTHSSREHGNFCLLALDRVGMCIAHLLISKLHAAWVESLCLDSKDSSFVSTLLETSFANQISSTKAGANLKNI